MTRIDPAEWFVHEFRAMGCAMSARLAVPSEGAIEPLIQVEQFFAQAERTLSRFDPASELSHLNALAGEWVRVSPLLWAVLDSALLMAVETDGYFDPTLLEALEAAGYTRSFDELMQELPEQPGGRPAGGRYREVQRRATERSVKVPPGTRLDLGGIAKGYIAQRAVERLRPLGPALVDAGGDLVAGAAPPGWPGWPVAVARPGADPAQAPDDLAMLWLANATLATSGVDYRRWRVGGRSAHHIIDPRTGRPAQSDLLTVSILDPDASRAEAWATATLIRGSQAGASALDRRGMTALLVDTNHHVRLTRAIRSYLVQETSSDVE